MWLVRLPGHSGLPHLMGCGGGGSGDREGGSIGALTATPPTPLLLKPQVFETELGIYGE